MLQLLRSTQSVKRRCQATHFFFSQRASGSQFSPLYSNNRKQLSNCKYFFSRRKSSSHINNFPAKILVCSNFFPCLQSVNLDEFVVANSRTFVSAPDKGDFAPVINPCGNFESALPRTARPDPVYGGYNSRTIDSPDLLSGVLSEQKETDNGGRKNRFATDSKLNAAVVEEKIDIYGAMEADYRSTDDSCSTKNSEIENVPSTAAMLSGEYDRVKNEAISQSPVKEDLFHEENSVDKNIDQIDNVKETSKNDGVGADQEWQREQREKHQKTQRNIRLGCFVTFGSVAAALVGFCVYYGLPVRDPNSGRMARDEFSEYRLSWIWRILNAWHLWRDYVIEPSRDNLLPDPLKYPYLQPKYTVVLEMKDVLVKPKWTYDTGWRWYLRPGLDYLLNTIGYPNFECVIYTSESAFTADSVVKSFDPNQRIIYYLYRDCTKYVNGHHVKDLNRLNRDLSKVIFVDIDPKSFQLNPENAIRINAWNGDQEDTSLFDLAELLRTIYMSDVDDVRPTLEYYSQCADPLKEFRKRAALIAEKSDSADAKQGKSLAKNYAGRMFGFRRHQVD